MTSNPNAGGHAPQSLRNQRHARILDREVAPVWHDRFSRLLFRDLPTGPNCVVLDVHAGPGHTTAGLLQRLDNSSRIVALEEDPALVGLAKARVRPEWKNRVYFKSGNVDALGDMAESTYDLTIANLVLGEHVHDWKAALKEFVRVTKPGGQVLATLPLRGTWDEVDDLFGEVLSDTGMRTAVASLQKLRRMRPRISTLAHAIEDLGFGDDDYVLEHERFELLFRSGREFLFSPVVEQGPLRLWKAILGKTDKPQALFWEFKEAIDTYYGGRVLAVGVHAGLIRLRVPDSEPAPLATTHWRRYPSLAKIWGMDSHFPDDHELPSEFDVDIDIDIDIEAGDETTTTTVKTADAQVSEPSTTRNQTSMTGIPTLDAMFEDDALDEIEDIDDIDEIDDIENIENIENIETDALDDEQTSADELTRAFGNMLLPDAHPTGHETQETTPGHNIERPAAPRRPPPPPPPLAGRKKIDS